jgi:hypothetical protein
MMKADPLAPAVKVQMAVVREIVTRELGRTDIEEMGFVAFVGERGGEATHAGSQAAGA